MDGQPAFVLASSSPRRIELLREAGYWFEVIPSNDPEPDQDHLDPASLALFHARNKATAVAARHPGRKVLGADTVVALDGQSLGKPADLDEAAEMLRRLSGRTHQVHTAVCLIGPELRIEFVETSQVRFRHLTAERIARYLASVPVLDKAGAYAAQAEGESVVEAIEGSFTNVVGLPMERLRQTFSEAGIHPGR